MTNAGFYLAGVLTKNATIFSIGMLIGIILSLTIVKIILSLNKIIGRNELKCTKTKK